jgi:hypothetical protein
MVLKYVTQSFHLPSVSTANINTLQYPKPHKQCEVPTIPAVVISKVLLTQSNITGVFVHSHSNLFSDVSPGLPKYNHNIKTKFLFSTATSSVPYGRLSIQEFGSLFCVNYLLVCF